jgi:chromosome segregation ATPase
MRGKIKTKKELTLGDLAAMVKGGFDEMEIRFDGQDKRFDSVEGRLEKVENRLEKVENRLEKVENRLEKAEGSLDNLWRHTVKLSAEVNGLKVGQEELKEIVTGVYRVEIRELKNRVEILEKKVGIS